MCPKGLRFGGNDGNSPGCTITWTPPHPKDTSTRVRIIPTEQKRCPVGLEGADSPRQ